MDLQTFFISRRGTELGMWLGRHMPPTVGRALAKLASSATSRRRDSPLVRAIRANQSVVRELPLEAPELDEAVREVLAGWGIQLPAQ